MRDPDRDRVDGWSGGAYCVKDHLHTAVLMLTIAAEAKVYPANPASTPV
jgi:hypothetical protein